MHWRRNTLKCVVNWSKLYINPGMCERLGGFRYICAYVVFSSLYLPFKVFCSCQQSGEIFSKMLEKNIINL